MNTEKCTDGKSYHEWQNINHVGRKQRLLESTLLLFRVYRRDGQAEDKSQSTDWELPVSTSKYVLVRHEKQTEK